MKLNWGELSRGKMSCQKREGNVQGWNVPLIHACDQWISGVNIVPIWERPNSQTMTCWELLGSFFSLLSSTNTNSLALLALALTYRYSAAKQWLSAKYRGLKPTLFPPYLFRIHPILCRLIDSTMLPVVSSAVNRRTDVQRFGLLPPKHP